MPQKLEDTFPAFIVKHAIRVIHEEKDYIAAWVLCYNKGEDVGSRVMPLHYVSDLNGNEIEHWDTERAVKIKVMQFRAEQLREELKLGDSIPDSDTLRNIFQRVWDGEWMGQFDVGNRLYVSELATLLNLSMSDMGPVIEELKESRIADIIPSTAIFGPPNDEYYSFDGHEVHGHLKLVSSDFGYWSCRSCGRSGDDMDNPEDVPCTRIEEM